MRFLFSLSLLTAVACVGCASQTANTSALASAEPAPHAVGLRAPAISGPAASFQRADGADPYIQAPTVRPGGDVILGETHASRKVATTFERLNGNIPSAEVILYYTDEQNAQSLKDRHKLPRAADAARADIGNGYVALNVRERLRGALPLLSSNGANYALIKPGQPSFFSIRNTLRQPVEVLIAVDGQSIIDNQPASNRQRGFVIDPGDTASVRAPIKQARGRITMSVFLSAGGR